MHPGSVVELFASSLRTSFPHSTSLILPLPAGSLSPPFPPLARGSLFVAGILSQKYQRVRRKHLAEMGFWFAWKSVEFVKIVSVSDFKFDYSGLNLISGLPHPLFSGTFRTFRSAFYHYYCVLSGSLLAV
jgi:hypothetical protein